MKKNVHDLHEGGKTNHNAHLFGNNTRVVATHPLKVSGEEFKSPAYATNTEKKGEFSEALITAKNKLEGLMRQHVVALPEKFKLSLCLNKAEQILLWAQIPFIKGNEASVQQAQRIVQTLVEPLQGFQARYGFSANSWLLLIPGFDKLDHAALLRAFEQQYALSWTRLSHPITTLCALYIPPVDISIRPLSEHPATPTKQLEETGASVKVPIAPAFLQTNDPNMQPSAEAVKLLTTIQDNQERVEAAQRLNMGKPNLEDSAMYFLEENKARLVYHVLMHYIEQQKLKTTRYSTIRLDPCLHHNLRMDAEATITDVIRQSGVCSADDVLIIAGLNPGIGPIYQACESAATKTIQSCKVVTDAQGRIYCDRIYYLHGEGKQIKLVSEDMSSTALIQGLNKQ